MAILQKPLQSVSKTLLGEAGGKKRGIVPTIVLGTGADQTMRALDNVLGSPLQRIFGFNLPFLGNVGVIDLINYLIFAGGFKISTQGLMAVAGAKAVGGVLPVLSGVLNIPGIGQAAQAGIPSGPGAPK